MLEQGLFDLGDLIVFGIILVLFFIYNRIDRNSKTLEKVRKYADKVRGELDKIIGQKKTEISDLSINLEVEEKKNREILARFSAARDDMLARSKDLEEFQKKIDNYGRYIDELQKMTVRIDENLLRLKEESVYIDTVGSRLTDVQKKENSLIKGLNAINAAFQQQNQEKLEEIRKSVVREFDGKLAEYSRDLKEMDDTVANFRDNLDELLARSEKAAGQSLEQHRTALEKLHAEYGSRINTAAEKASKLEDEIFSSLEAGITERSRSLEENWVGGISELKEKVVAMVAEINGTMEENRKQFESLFSENQERIGEINDKFTVIEEDVREQASRLMERQKELVGEYEDESALWKR